MLTAHLPSGNVLARRFPRDVHWLIPVELIGAVLPDFDMLLFHFVDDRSIHHHRYWVHVPVFGLVTVPPTQSHWIASFILHWTFLLELIIWSVVIVMWRKRQGS